MKKLLAIAAFLLASTAAQAQYSFEYGGRTIRIDPDRGTVSIPGVYDNTGRRSKRARGDQREAGHDGGDILERAQQKCSAQRPERLRLLIPGHRRYVPEKAPPQAEGHGKNDQSENKELECGADRHWYHSSSVPDASIL